MATFNGADYLEEQLQSLLAQTILPAELIVGDDGSTDDTIDMLEHFRVNAPFPVEIKINRSKLGFADNFLRTAASAKSKWVAFCDQDDVWLPHKLEQSWTTVRGSGDALKMVVQGMRLVDSELRPLPQRGFITKREKRTHRLGQHGFWVHPGFSQTVRADLLQSIPFDDRPPGGVAGAPIAHDRWTCILANALGDIAYVPGAASLWRRHERSVMMGAAADGAAANAASVLSPDERYCDELRTLSASAANFSIALEQTAAKVSDPNVADHLCKAASKYDELAELKLARAEIYRRQGRAERAMQLIRVIGKGAYSGPAFVREGKRETLRDVHACIRGWRGAA